MIGAEIKLALASDYNPGTAPSGNMNMVVSLACIRLKMTPEEAINAATINGALPWNYTEQVGSKLSVKSSFILTEPIPVTVIIPLFLWNHPILKGVL